MTFTDQLHEQAATLWQQSFDHPFIQQISAGTLPKAVFRFYLLQDRYYLSEFGKLHEQVASQVTNPKAEPFCWRGPRG
ncbi:hypothetical protein [Secundilactobacillus kimchicus]|uniref:hypothetical protein n=1 Tax=Secundilactobacillus kimchicus TaxID=528209 RepID=UPI000AF0FC60